MSRTFIVLGIAVTMFLAACSPQVVRIDRTEGLALECLWTTTSRDRIAYYTVASDGMFRSAGGALASDRGTSFAIALSDDDVALFVKLTRATDFTTREEPTTETGDRTNIRVRHAGDWHEFTVFGADPSVDALRTWCASVSLRQFNDIIQAQPQAGPRMR